MFLQLLLLYMASPFLSITLLKISLNYAFPSVMGSVEDVLLKMYKLCVFKLHLSHEVTSNKSPWTEY